MINEIKWSLFAIFILFNVAFASYEECQVDSVYSAWDDVVLTSGDDIINFVEQNDTFTILTKNKTIGNHLELTVLLHKNKQTITFLTNETTFQKQFKLAKTKINEEPNPEFIAEMSKNIYKKEEENLKVPDECMVCYQCFPVSFQFSCGHEVCAVCAESIMILCNKTCPKCRVPLPQIIREWLPMIKFYPIFLTPDTPVKKLQIAFPLICSVANLTTITNCVKMGIIINTEGFSGYFPVHFATQKSVLKYLLNNGADVNQTANYGFARGENPLFMSSYHGHLPMVQYLIENGANVNQERNDGATPLHVSSHQGHLPIVKYLVENGDAMVDQPNNAGFTPLHVSSHQGNLPIVKYLVENGSANVNQTSNNGVAPLTISMLKNQTDVAKFLLQKNANIEATKLFFKNNNGSEYIDILEKLCKEMEKTKIINEMQNQKRKRAEENLKVSHKCMVCYEHFPLLFQFPCCHEICAVCAESIFKSCNNSYECLKCRMFLPTTIKKWLTMIKIYPIHLTPDTPLEKLQIAFPLICSVANLTTITECVKMGIKINTKGFKGFFPVHLVSQRRVLKYLLDNGANVNESSNCDFTPLHLSSHHGYLRMVKYLVKNGANINQPRNNGETPLATAIFSNQTDVAIFLLKINANIEATKLFFKNNNGSEYIDILGKLCKEMDEEIGEKQLQSKE